MYSLSISFSKYTVEFAIIWELFLHCSVLRNIKSSIFFLLQVSKLLSFIHSMLPVSYGTQILQTYEDNVYA